MEGSSQFLLQGYVILRPRTATAMHVSKALNLQLCNRAQKISPLQKIWLNTSWFYFCFLLPQARAQSPRVRKLSDLLRGDDVFQLVLSRGTGKTLSESLSPLLLQSFEGVHRFEKLGLPPLCARQKKRRF